MAKKYIKSLNIKVGDLVALVTLGDGTKAVKVIGETKNYFRVDLRHLPKGHMARFTFECNREPEEIILDSRLYHKVTGYERGSGDYESIKYCANYIMELAPRLDKLKREYEKTKNMYSLELYNKELLADIQAIEKAIREGIPA